MATKTVLIVDRELGFVFWLGQALDRAGYEALPAKSIADASDLLGQLKLEIDLLIVSQSLGGAREFAATLRRSQGHLKVLALIGEQEEPDSAFPEADAFERRLSNLDDASRLEWLETVQNVLDPADCALGDGQSESETGEKPLTRTAKDGGGSDPS
ncbi:MAG: response regulator [Acidobacteriia bacterium]|nr:response regulator [Terriglobia bacterium]